MGLAETNCNDLGWVMFFMTLVLFIGYIITLILWGVYGDPQRLQDNLVTLIVSGILLMVMLVSYFIFWKSGRGQVNSMSQPAPNQSAPSQTNAPTKPKFIPSEDFRFA